jgi:hypothetical protein
MSSYPAHARARKEMLAARPMLQKLTVLDLQNPGHLPDHFIHEHEEANTA